MVMMETGFERDFLYEYSKLSIYLRFKETSKSNIRGQQ